jgi:hypothetical protein
MPAPRSLVGAWREMRMIWHKQQLDPSYEFDTPVPAPSQARADGGGGSSHDGGLVTEDVGASLGDIAPVGLKQD